MSINNTSIYTEDKYPPIYVFDSLPDKYTCLLNAYGLRHKKLLHNYMPMQFSAGIFRSSYALQYYRAGFSLRWVWFLYLGNYFEGKTYNYAEYYDLFMYTGFYWMYRHGHSTRIKGRDESRQWCDSYHSKTTYSLRFEVEGDNLYLYYDADFYGAYIASDEFKNSDGYLVFYASIPVTYRLMRFRRVDLLCTDFKFQEIKGLLGG